MCACGGGRFRGGRVPRRIGAGRRRRQREEGAEAALRRLSKGLTAPAGPQLEKRVEGPRGPGGGRAMLKTMSEERSQKWPNTIQALRIKKEAKRMDKQEEEEEARRKVDKIEGDIRAEARRLQIERANRMLYDDSSRVKSFHGSLMMSDVLQEREEQIKYKKALKVRDRHIEHAFLVKQQRVLEIAEVAEQRKIEEKRSKAFEQRDAQLLQLEEVRERMIAEKVANQKEGQLLRAQAVEEKKMQEDRERARREKAKELTMETMKANQALRELKAAELRRERDAEDAIAAFARKKEEAILERKRREEAKMQAKTDARNRMIDRMEEELSKARQDVESRLSRQQEEAQARTDAEIARRDERRSQELAAIDKSRKQQLSLRKQAADAEKDADQRFRKAWQTRTVELKQEEEDEKRFTFDDNKRNQKVLLRQMEYKARKKEGALRKGMEEAMLMKAQMQQDERMFNQYAEVCLDEWQAQGKSLKPMQIQMNRKETLG